jgi:hypothetical protein
MVQEVLFNRAMVRARESPNVAAGRVSESTVPLPPFLLSLDLLSVQQPYSERVRCHATTLRLQIQHDGAALSGT